MAVQFLPINTTRTIGLTDRAGINALIKDAGGKSNALHTTNERSRVERGFNFELRDGLLTLYGKDEQVGHLSLHGGEALLAWGFVDTISLQITGQFDKDSYIYITIEGDYLVFLEVPYDNERFTIKTRIRLQEPRRGY